MSLSGISLRQLVEKYVEAGERIGLNSIDLCLGLLQSEAKDIEYYALWLVKACENNERKEDNRDLVNPGMDMDTYLIQMLKVLPRVGGKPIPKLEEMVIGRNILYTIHQKVYLKYRTVEEFFEVLRHDFGMVSSCRVQILGDSLDALYPGLMACTSRFLTKTENKAWPHKDEKGRLEILEKMEKRIFEEIVKEWRKTL